jgi:hypothetical protein
MPFGQTLPLDPQAKKKPKMIKNNSWAMIATVSVVAALASVIGLLNPTNCVESAQLEGWTSCAAIADQQRYLFWGLLAVSAFGFAISLVRRAAKKRR